MPRSRPRVKAVKPQNGDEDLSLLWDQWMRELRSWDKALAKPKPSSRPRSTRTRRREPA